MGDGVSYMMFEKRKQERKKQKDKNQRSLAERFHKFIFLFGAALALKGLKAWIGDKRKKMR